jgi:hypothetical protein
MRNCLAGLLASGITLRGTSSKLVVNNYQKCMCHSRTQSRSPLSNFFSFREKTFQVGTRRLKSFVYASKHFSSANFVGFLPNKPCHQQPLMYAPMPSTTPINADALQLTLSVNYTSLSVSASRQLGTSIAADAAAANAARAENKNRQRVADVIGLKTRCYFGRELGPTTE